MKTHIRKSIIEIAAEEDTAEAFTIEDRKLKLQLGSLVVTVRKSARVVCVRFSPWEHQIQSAV